AGSISYQAVDTLSISLGSGGNNFTIASTQSQTRTTLNAGTGDDTVTVQSTSSLVAVSLGAGVDTANVRSIDADLTVDAGSGNDTINVDSTAPGTGGTLSGIRAQLNVAGDDGDAD